LRCLSMWCLQAATRSPGVDLAVDLVLSTMSTHTSLPSGFDAPPQPAKLVCLVRKDLGMGTGKVAAQAITERASVSGTPENAYARLPPLQVAHGALAAYRAAVRRRDAGDASVPFRSWEEGGEPTVVLGVEDEARASVDSQPKHR
jgi:peptidyl-tRNA hydrolase